MSGRGLRAVVVLALAGCGGGALDGDGDGGANDAAAGSVVIVAPTEGALFVRDQLGADGTFVAPIEFRAQASGGVASVEWLAEGTFALGVGMPPDFALGYEYHGDGDRWVDAVAHDASGAQLGRATVAFTVAPPAPTDCQGMLGAMGVDFVEGPASPGVPDPVTVTLPIAGMPYRYSGNPAPRNTWMMDCELALALARASQVYLAHGIVEVTDIGIYNYRCIDQSQTPPDCGGGSLSMHAYAQAIDIAGLTDAAGTYYSVNDDWVIDPDGADTCTTGTANAKDAFLHAVICDLHAASVFNIYLNPNYNAAHRNHWHLDLTPGADFLSREAPGGAAVHADERDE